jgi:hypothetical protein
VIVPASGGPALARFPVHRLWPGEAARPDAGREIRVVLAWFAELSQRMRGPA